MTHDPDQPAAADMPVTQQPTPGDGGAPVMVRNHSKSALHWLMPTFYGAAGWTLVKVVLPVVTQEQQDRHWGLSPQQAPKAAKRLGQRVTRRMKTAVRHIRHPKSGGDGDDGSDSDNSSAGEEAGRDSDASTDTMVGTPTVDVAPCWLLSPGPQSI